MVYLIASTTLLIGLAGMSAIFLSKRSLLNELPEDFKEKEDFSLKLKTKIKNFDLPRIFDLKSFLKKFFTSIRILSLKVDNMTSQKLESLRNKDKEEIANNYQDDSYWKKLRRKIKK